MKASLKDAIRSYMKQRATTLPAPEGPTIDIRKGPALCVIPLLAFTRQSPTLPDDFQTDVQAIVAAKQEGERDGQAVSRWLQQHVRGDGAVFLGSFALPHERDSVLLVYGDVNTTDRAAQQASMAYRRLATLAQDERIPSLGSEHAAPAPTATKRILDS